MNLYKCHILDKLNESKVDQHPFHHLFIENIFPIDLYQSINGVVCDIEISNKFEFRPQDNVKYLNKRFPIFDHSNPRIQQIKTLFEDKDIKDLVLSKFFINFPIVGKIGIHENEFEFVCSDANRFQNIHVDVPAKFLSFVFYFPNTTTAISQSEQYDNGTILYDKNLQPIKKAKYVPNSVCIFAPHLYSYHGFNTTIPRTALVMFYVDKSIFNHFGHSELTIESFKDLIITKLSKYPLIEYSNDADKMQKEKSICKINDPNGRVMIQS